MEPGYERLAQFMGRHPEVATFRRFGALNAQIILYLQAELTYLEHDLRKHEKANAESGHTGRALYSRYWPYLAESASSPHRSPEQWNTMLKIKEVLREYSKQQSASRRDSF